MNPITYLKRREPLPTSQVLFHFIRFHLGIS